MEYIFNAIPENTLAQLFALMVVLLIIAGFGKLVGLIVSNIAKRYKNLSRTTYVALLMAISKSIIFILCSITFWLYIPLLEFENNISEILRVASKILITISVGYFAFHLVDIPCAWYAKMTKNSETGFNQVFLPTLKSILRTIIVIIIIFHIIQLLSNKPLTSIIAGLGIGGLAVALAAQDTLKHFIGSFVLVGDKPFAIGDRIVIDGHDGPVESIGLRSTKIRTLNGHLISIPNGVLANKTIQNIGKRDYIKHEANILLSLETMPDKINKAVSIIKELLQNHEGINEEFPPRVYFNGINRDSFNILYLYWYHPPEYWNYLAFNEKLNEQILKKFRTEEIKLAYPIQKVIVDQ